MSPPPDLPVLAVSRGPRAGESALLAALAPRAQRPRLSDLALPVRVLVPSRSLRRHLERLSVRHLGATVGLRFQTLYAAALEILERAGLASPPGEALLPLRVRRAARGEPSLSAHLDGLEDGYAGVVASVEDLLDAGFERHHAEPLAEALAAAAPGPQPLDRASAVVRVTTRVAAELEAGALGHGSLLYRRACEQLLRSAADALPSRALFVYGFQDATGVQADLIEALMRRCEAHVWIEEPGGVDSGAVFAERFRRRLEAVAGRAEPVGEALPPPVLEILHAPGEQAEVRAVAGRIRELLDAGTQPEGIGVVARELGRYRAQIRTHFLRLGIPFSTEERGAPPGPAERAALAVLELLSQRGRTRAERWLDATRQLPGEPCELGGSRRADLLLGLHVLGAARVDEAARLARPEAPLELPMRLGLGRDGRRRPARRELAQPLLAAAVSAAADLWSRLEAWPGRAPLRTHLHELRALLHGPLGWSRQSPEAACVEAAVQPLAPCAAEEVSRDELEGLLRRLVTEGARAPLGGAGAGAQVLTVMEARSRSFEHLFVLGLCRDAFPRVVREDPLLRDSLRRAARSVLEELSIKSDGHDEERFLFAQLLAAAPRVTLSAPLRGDDGRARPVSPLLQRLSRRPEAPEPQVVASLYGRAELASSPRPAHEHAVRVGLYASRAGFAHALSDALEEAGWEPVQAAALGRLRAAVLAEQDAGPLRSPGLGPYLGLVGRPGRRDPRRGELFVTAAEALARCPWQGFLRRVLRLEPIADPHAELPSAEPRLVGSVVHAVLERCVLVAAGPSCGPDRLEEVLRREPRSLPWPEPAALEALLVEEAERVAGEAGIRMPGFARLLALRARPFLGWARRLDWPEGASRGVLGVEVEGQVELSQGRLLRFVADRVDRGPEGLRLVDYKTGRPPSQAVRPETRRSHLLSQVAQGKLLQTVAYARAAAACAEPHAEARYLHLDPRRDVAERVFDARAGDAELAAAFDAATSAIFGAWEQGAFVPRLVEPGDEEEPHFCESCEVKEACLRGDSGARQRLVAWWRSSSEGGPGESADPTGEAPRAIFGLPVRGAGVAR